LLIGGRFVLGISVYRYAVFRSDKACLVATEDGDISLNVIAERHELARVVA
jgi:hypothetical protein